MKYVPNCQFEQIDEGCYGKPGPCWKCVKCGFISPVEALQNCDKFGWGDRVEQVTSALGIKKCGGCSKRQKSMNKWGKKK